MNENPQWPSQVPQPAPLADQSGSSQGKVKWYHQKWFVVLMLLFFFPVGIGLLWTSPVTRLSGRIVWSSLFALAVLVSLGGGMGDVAEPSVSQGVDTGKASSGAPVVAKEPAPKAPPKEEYNLKVTDEASGQVFKGKIVSDVGFAVLEVEPAASVGDSFFAQQASGGAVFVLVTVYVTNDQRDAITLDGSLFTLLHDGREYSYSIEASTALEMSDQKESFFLKKLNPGLNMVGVVPFEVPKGLSLDQAELQVRGGMTGRTARLPLMPMTE